MQNAGPADIQIGEARGVRLAFDAMPAGFDADELGILVIAKGVEEPDGVAAAADAGDAGIGQLAGLRLDLLARFGADHALEIAHHHRIWMRTQSAEPSR